MATSQICPEIRDLKLLALGQLPEPVVEQLGQHILTCASCATQLDSLLSGDPLLPELAAAPTQQPPDNPLVDALIERLVAQPLAPHALVTPSSAATVVNAKTAASAPALSLPGYEVLEELGRGGQSVVYKARQLALDRLVALKVISTVADAGDRERFRREAEAVAHLEHPHIVRIYDLGEQTRQPYFALEYMSGGTLAKKLAGTPLPTAEAAQTLETLARTMDWAHQRGIVHRDLKPANVLLTADGLLKVTDFGLAKRLNAEGHLTHTGYILGTPCYMAPEQAAGKNKEVGPAADVYALGTILYEMLTGRPPFLGDSTLDILAQVLHTDPVSPRRLRPRLPRDLETICLKCLHKDSQSRYASAAALAEDLQRHLAGQPIQARRVGVFGRLLLRCRRKPALTVTIALACVAITIVGGAAGIQQVLQEQQRFQQLQASQAAGLVERLRDAHIAQVPAILTEIEPYREAADPLLREYHARAANDSRQKLHMSLALLPVDPSQVDYLCQRLLRAEPHEVPVLRDALAPHQAALLDKLWAAVEQPHKGQEAQRLRAACALARYDPDNRRWHHCSAQLADDLVKANPVFLGLWLEGCRPLRKPMLPALTRIFCDTQRRETERSLATSILMEYAADQPTVLAELVLDADATQFAAVLPILQQHQQRARIFLEGEVDKQLAGIAHPDAKEKLAKRQANAAVALLKMNHAAKVWQMLKFSPDPRVRSYLIHRLGPLGSDRGFLVQRLREEPDVTIRRALVLSLGPQEFGKQTWSPEQQQQLVQQLQEMYRTAADPGLHAAAEWLLRQWQEEEWLAQTDAAWARDHGQRAHRCAAIRQQLPKQANSGAGPRVPPQWYVNAQGQTMVVIPGPVQFWMGSPPGEAGRFAEEAQHRKQIPRTYAIAAKPVTVKQYLQFRKDHDYNKERAPTNACPVNSINLLEAAEYCNWLSAQEGIPRLEWCYEMDSKGRVTKLTENYLRKLGYRLPSEAEWEYACRAETVTSRYYGESEELLDKYAWFIHNSKEPSWPVGTKKPNDLGLFDMHGNVWCWCQQSYQSYPKARDHDIFDDKEDALSIVATSLYVSRGGSFRSHPRHVRSADGNCYEPTTRVSNVGFRPARTFR